MATSLLSKQTIDLKQTLSDNRLLGLWRMLAGFRLIYAGAMASQALSAVAKTTTSLLLAYLVDKVLLQNRIGEGILLIAVAFVALAVVEGTFSFMTGKLSA
ncbi:MAG: ABC transporter ATP-binding protein, partial [Chloroflexota bacterium]